MSDSVIFSQKSPGWEIGFIWWGPCQMKSWLSGTGLQCGCEPTSLVYSLFDKSVIHLCSWCIWFVSSFPLTCWKKYSATFLTIYWPVSYNFLIAFVYHWPRWGRILRESEPRGYILIYCSSTSSNLISSLGFPHPAYLKPMQ